MTLRYHCEECGASLKIKDELAGTRGVCPKCKTKFTVPDKDHVSEHADGNSSSGDGNSSGDGKKKKRKAERAPIVAVPGSGEIPASGQGVSGDGISGDGVSFDTVTAHAAMEDTAAPASRVAADLMKRSAAESKKSNQKPYWQEKEPLDKKEEGINWAEVATYAVTRVIPGLVGVVVLFLGVYWVSAAFLLTGPKRPPLGTVTGVVTLDDEPLANATLFFHPMKEANTKVDATSSTGRTDASGRYSLLYVDGVRGAAVGRHTVEIQASGEDGRQLVPSRYFNFGATLSELSAEVESGRNEINFDLVSDP